MYQIRLYLSDHCYELVDQCSLFGYANQVLTQEAAKVPPLQNEVYIVEKVKELN